LEDDKFDIPFESIHFSDIHSQFVEINVYINTSTLSLEEKHNIEIFLDTFFEVPVMINGKLVPYEKVVESLDEDILSRSNSCGLNSGSSFSCGDFPDFAVISVKTKKEKYERGIFWLKTLLYDSVYTSER
jgi:Zn-dependent M16 (insulinase) family peptidase